MHANIKVFGRVQAVWFRRSAQKEARKLKLAGLARNLPDGSVYIEAEGAREALDKFIDWCRQGPKLAKISRIDFEYSSELKGFSNFLIQ
jgi:acylphosphatase